MIEWKKVLVNSKFYLCEVKETCSKYGKRKLCKNKQYCTLFTCTT